MSFAQNDELNGDEPFLIICNHVTAFDGALVLYALPGRVRRRVACAMSRTCAQRPAQDALAKDLAGLGFRDPAFPVAANVSATLVSAGNAAREALVAQVTGAVRWVECVQLMVREGATQFIEVGPGRVLSGLMRQIQGKDAATPVLNVEDSASLEKAVVGMRGG